jgi:hypothetical protein
VLLPWLTRRALVEDTCGRKTSGVGLDRCCWFEETRLRWNLWEDSKETAGNVAQLDLDSPDRRSRHTLFVALLGCDDAGSGGSWD